MRLLDIMFRIMRVSHLGRGFFRVQFELVKHASVVLAWSPVDFMDRQTQGMYLVGMNARLIVPRDFQVFSQSLQHIYKKLGAILAM